MKNRQKKLNRAASGKKPSLRVLYGTKGGRVLLKGFINPTASDLMGKFMSSKASSALVPGFVRRTGIDMSRYEPKKYRTYNEFFTRKLASPPEFSSDPAAFCSPCEGFVTAYRISENSVFEIKDTDYSISDLLCSKKLSDTYTGGTCVIFRLAVHNYHRYCFFDGGHAHRTHSVTGCLHTVQPIAFEHFDVYKHNSREYTVMDTDNFGLVTQIEVGAMFVGRIVNYPATAEFKRGQEKGYFEFGGSTVILLFRPGTVSIDKNIAENSLRSIETPVEIGQRIGTALRSAK